MQMLPEQPDLGQGTAGARAPSALLATSHRFGSWGNPQSCLEPGGEAKKSSEEFAQGGAQVKPFLRPRGDGELGGVGEVITPPRWGKRQL